jgi:UDP-N-acetylglucosamine acyltransferase
MVAGGSHVRKDIPPYAMAAQYPVAYTGVNLVGLRRRGFSNDQIGDIQDTYRNIYLRGMNVSDAVNEMQASATVSPERQLILDFIKNSPKGIIRGPEKGDVKDED